MRVVVIEDCLNDFQYFRGFFKKYFDEHELVYYSKSSDFLKKENIDTIDLLVLDVELPDLNAIDLLKSFKHYKFEVLFCTASDIYALEAFKFQSLGYLLKPYTELDFLKTLTNVMKIIRAKRFSDQTMLKNIHYITIPSSTSILFFPMDDILRLESKQNYTTVYCVNSESCLSSYGIKYFEPQLLDHTFFRCHKSHIINLKHIKKYYLDGTIIMSNGDKIPLARRRRQEFIDNYSFNTKQTL